MLPQSPSALGIEVLTTLHDLIPFVFCLYGVQVHCPCALEARSHIPSRASASHVSNDKNHS